MSTENVIQKIDKEDILKTYQMYKAEGHFVEARLLGTTKGIISGYFNNEQDFVEELMKYNGEVKGIYVTLNPIEKLSNSLQVNKLHPYVKGTTKDKDIAYRRWLLVDIDPKRPANMSSTQEEFEAAWEVASKIQVFTDELGWSKPVKAISGNGAHLLYPIHLPNDKESTDFIKNVLRALHEKFSTEIAEVDMTTYNAARISKVYGTLACKGEHTEERPHTLAKVVEFAEWIPVSKGNLETVAKMAKVVKKEKTTSIPSKEISKRSGQGLNIEAFMKRHSIGVHHTKKEDDYTIYVLEECPWNSEHTDTAAFIQQFDNGALVAGCHHASCQGNDWKSLREMLEPKKVEDSVKSKAEKACEILNEVCENLPLYYDEMDVPYTLIQRKQRKETVEIQQDDFKQYLTYHYLKKTGKHVPRESIERTILSMTAKAMYEGEKRDKYLRVAMHDGALYYNLANEKGEVVKVTNNSITIEPTDEVFFRKTSNEKKQVTPDINNGDITKLFNYVRMSEENQLLYTVYVCTAFLSMIPHAILILTGEKGASKSCTMMMTRQLIDPAKQPKLQLTKQDRDFTATLYANYVASYDNIRGFSKDKSDTFCMTSTGGAIPLRKLYTTSEEVLLDIRRVVMLNGINLSVTEPDLVDRSLSIELARIPEEERKTEIEVFQNFDRDKPVILGGIFNILQKAMNIYPTVQIAKLPRLADFAEWAYAIAEAIEEGKGEAFLKAYENNRMSFNSEVIQTHPVSTVIALFMQDKSEWRGSMSSLLDSLDDIAASQRVDTKDKHYPYAASILSRRLKEVKSNLKDIGITYSIRNVGQYKEITLVNSAFQQIPAFTKDEMSESPSGIL